MPKKIRITIARDGTVRAETIGIKGPACTSLLPVFERLTNARVTDSAFTAEYHQQATEEQQAARSVQAEESDHG